MKQNEEESENSETSSNCSSILSKEDLENNDSYSISNYNPFKIYETISNSLKLKINCQKEELQYLTTQKNLESSNITPGKILEYKFLVTGEHSTGKTSFCMRFALNKFNLEIKSSKNIECYLKTIILFNKEIKIYLIDIDLDTLLEKDYNNFLYEDIKAVLCLYDITKIKTFEKAKKLIKELKQKTGNVIPYYLIGNKTDLKYIRNVNYKDAKEKAKMIKCELKETNCVEVKLVEDIIKYIVAKIFYENLDDLEKERVKLKAIDEVKKRKENIKIKKYDD